MKPISSADIIVAQYAGLSVTAIAATLHVPIGLVINELIVHDQKMREARAEIGRQRRSLPRPPRRRPAPQVERSHNRPRKQRSAGPTVRSGSGADQPPRFLPSLEEIADACKAIRAGWSDREYYKRHRVATTLGSIDDIPERHRMSVQEVRCVDWSVN